VKGAREWNKMEKVVEGEWNKEEVVEEE